MNATGTIIRVGAVATVVIGVGLLFTFERPPVETVQSGYRGTGMAQVINPRILEAKLAVNQPPAEVEAVPPEGPLASAVYENVQVLGDLTEVEFLGLMTAITEWVSPEQGCTYCHTEDGNFASDAIYTKVVSRRMLEMTRRINTAYDSHVGATGVTCFTCHRGQPVPQYIWFQEPERQRARGNAATPASQNIAAPEAGYSSLPNDPFSAFYTGAGDADIRVVSDTALPTGNRRSIKQTEWTYGLMMHMSQSLGVNCTYCHNSRSFMDWDQSSPQRITAWHGIQMVRELNAEYLTPLQPVYPPIRLGALGDAPKANCTTCHQGVYKPLFGAGMLNGFPSLDRPGTTAAQPAPPAAPTPQ